MQHLSKIVDEAWCLRSECSDDVYLSISTKKEVDVEFYYIIVNGVRYIKDSDANSISGISQMGDDCE